MSDLAAVRIHSKTTSIFSSRPIISRKRWTDGRSVLVADRRAPLEELVEQVADRVLFGLHERVSRRAAAGDAVRDAERDELADAVLDVEPHAAERLHQRLDVEGLLGPGAQEAEQRRAQRRLHERLKSRLDVRRLGSATGDRKVLHVSPRLLWPLSGRAAARRPGRGSTPTGTAR